MISDNRIKEVYSLTINHQAPMANLMAQELLTDAMQAWHNDNNNDSARDLVAASTAYAETLLALSRLKEAYAACMVAIAYTANNQVAATDMLAIYITAWHIFEQTLALAESHPESEAQPYIAAITADFGTMLYHYYYATGRECPDSMLLNDGYDALRTIMQFVDIKNEVGDHRKVISDLLMRSEAIGLIE